MNRCRPVTQSEIHRVCHLQQGKAKAGVHGNHLLDFVDIRLILRHRHHQAEKIALKIRPAMSLCRKLLCDMSSLHRIRTQRHRLLVLFLRLNIRDNAFFVHAVRNVNNIVHGGICCCLGIELDIIEAIQ